MANDDKRTELNQLDEGDWLHALLAEGQMQIAKHPKPQAVKRIRQRLFDEIERPEQAAA
ncbi:MAG: hypothetical protein IIC26_06310 [Chloroflexi bacterium]|nr:hypothetical protein [Chloroflexota bacterium]